MALMNIEKGVHVECPTPKQIEAWLEAHGYGQIETYDNGNEWCLGVSCILVVHTGSEMWLVQKAYDAIDDLAFSSSGIGKTRLSIYNEIIQYPKE